MLASEPTGDLTVDIDAAGGRSRVDAIRPTTR
jgi:hypothetical protein